MSGFGRYLSVLSFVIAALAAAPGWAQDGPQNLDAGKSAAQLFSSDCGICHKSPQGLARSGGVFGLESFLREHYTASREAAGALAAYLRAAGDAPAPARPRTKQPPKGDGKEKKPAAGPSDPSKASAKPDEKKPAEDAKSAEPKPPESKPSESKPAEAKPADAKPAEAKPE